MSRAEMVEGVGRYGNTRYFVGVVDDEGEERHARVVVYQHDEDDGHSISMEVEVGDVEELCRALVEMAKKARKS